MTVTSGSPEGRNHRISIHITVILITNMVKRNRNQSVSNNEFFEVVSLRRKLREGCSIDEDAARPYYEALWLDAHGKEQYDESEVVITDISSYPENAEWLAKVELRYKQGKERFTRIPPGRATTRSRSIEEAPRSAPSPEDSVLVAVNLDQVLDDEKACTANAYCNMLAPYPEWAAHSKEARALNRLQNRDIGEFNELLKTTIIDRRHGLTRMPHGDIPVRDITNLVPDGRVLAQLAGVGQAHVVGLDLDRGLCHDPAIGTLPIDEYDAGAVIKKMYRHYVCPIRTSGKRKQKRKRHVNWSNPLVTDVFGEAPPA